MRTATGSHGRVQSRSCRDSDGPAAGQHANGASATAAPSRRSGSALSVRRGVTTTRRTAAIAASASSDAPLPILYDIPVSNNGARNRLIIYWKQLESSFAITNPSALGGIKSDEYMALNPQGKMPLLVLPNGLALPESEVISQYICDAYSEVGPSLIPDDPETRAVAALDATAHAAAAASNAACTKADGCSTSTDSCGIEAATAFDKYTGDIYSEHKVRPSINHEVAVVG